MRKRSLRAFSLIEIMVAVVLMGMMGALLMAAINSSANAKDKIEEISGRNQMVRQALIRMSREISMAYLSKNINLVDPAYITQFKGKKDSLYFSAFGNIVRQKDAKQSDQQVLGFYLGTDKDGQKALMRKANPNLNLDVQKGGRAQVLCPGVSKIEFGYYNSTLEKWDEEWIADPSGMVAMGSVGDQEQDRGATQKQWSLPSFVKISMTADMGDGVEMVWVSQTYLPLKDPIDFNE